MSGNGEPNVYNTTTEDKKEPTKCFMVPTDLLSMPRFLLKVTEVLLSFLAFVLEEVVYTCVDCTALYCFEFVSCTAFMFTLLLLVLLSTCLKDKIKFTPAFWVHMDFWYTLVIAVLFLCSSLAFATRNDGTAIEQAAAAFGFLSTIAFFADTVMFFRARGFPRCTGAEKTPESNGGPEAAPLNSSSSQPANGSSSAAVGTD